MSTIRRRSVSPPPQEDRDDLHEESESSYDDSDGDYNEADRRFGKIDAPNNEDEGEYYSDNEEYDGQDGDDEEEPPSGRTDGDDDYYEEEDEGEEVYEEGVSSASPHYNRRSDYAREDSLDTDELMLSNELFPITEASVSSNRTTSMETTTAGSGGGGSAGTLNSGQQQHLQQRISGGSGTTQMTMTAHSSFASSGMLTSASTINSSGVLALFQRTGSSGRGSQLISPEDRHEDAGDPSDAYDENGSQYDENYDEDEEGDTTLQNTVTEDDDGEDEDQPSLSQYTERTYATTTATDSNGSKRSVSSRSRSYSSREGSHSAGNSSNQASSQSTRSSTSHSALVSQGSYTSGELCDESEDDRAREESVGDDRSASSSGSSSHSRSNSPTGSYSHHSCNLEESDNQSFSHRSGSDNRSYSHPSGRGRGNQTPSYRSGNDDSQSNSGSLSYRRDSGDQSYSNRSGDDDSQSYCRQSGYDARMSNCKGSNSSRRSHTQRSRRSHDDYVAASGGADGDDEDSRLARLHDRYRSHDSRSGSSLHHHDSQTSFSHSVENTDDDSGSSPSDSTGSQHSPNQLLSRSSSHHNSNRSTSSGSLSRSHSHNSYGGSRNSRDKERHSDDEHDDSQQLSSSLASTDPEEAAGRKQLSTRSLQTRIEEDDVGEENEYLPPEDSYHESAIIRQKRARDHSLYHQQQNHSHEQGYLSGESQATPKRANIAESSDDDEEEEMGDASTPGHGITDEAIFEALQESGLAGIEGVVVEVSDDGVVMFSSSGHPDGVDDNRESSGEEGEASGLEYDSMMQDTEGKVGQTSAEPGGGMHRDQANYQGESEDRELPRVIGQAVRSLTRPSLRGCEEARDLPSQATEVSSANVDDSLAPADELNPLSPPRSRGVDSSGPGSPVAVGAVSAQSGSEVSEAGWTSVTSDTNLSNSYDGSDSSGAADDETGPKLPIELYDDSMHDDDGESEAHPVDEYSDARVLSQKSAEADDASSASFEGDSLSGSEANSERSEQYSRGESRDSESRSESDSYLSPPGTAGSINRSRAGLSHTHSTGEEVSRSEATESVGSFSRDLQGRPVHRIPDTPVSANIASVYTEAQSFSELDDPTRLNKARARLLAAYASSGYDDRSTGQGEELSGPLQVKPLGEITQCGDSDYNNIDELAIAVAAGTAAAAEAASEDDEVFVDKVDVWDTADDDKKAEFETSQRGSSTSQNDRSLRSQTSRQSRFEAEHGDPLQEPNNSYGDGYHMDIEEPVYHEDSFYEEKIPHHAYGRPVSYQEHLFAGFHEQQANAVHVTREAALSYGYGEKESQKLESSPSVLLPALSIDAGDDSDDDDDDDEEEEDDDDDDDNTDGAQDPENPDRKKIKISLKSDDAERATSAITKRDCRRVGGAILITVIIMLCVFLPVLLTRRSSYATPPPTPIQTNAPTLSPSSRLQPQYVVAGGPLGGPVGSKFGASVAFQDGLIAVGATGTGGVSTFATSNLGWEMVENLTGQADSLFGKSISLAGTGLLVGSPDALDVSFTATTGAAYFFQRNQVDDTWSILGSALPGYSVTLKAGDRFGEAVAASRVYRVAVGSPGGDGKVYVFQYRQTTTSTFDWLQMTNSPLFGLSATGRFGSSVDVSADGLRVVGGAPGDGAGVALVYVLSSATFAWELEFQIAGASVEESFGSSVRFLSETGDCLIVGGPGAENGNGIVRVYTAAAGVFEPLGPAIVGGIGEALGTSKTIGGGQIGDEIFVLAGTQTGLVRRFDFVSSTQSWANLYSNVYTGISSPISSLSTDGQKSFAVGQADFDQALLFSVKGDDVPTREPNHATTFPSVGTFSPVAPSVPTASPSVDPVTSTPGSPMGTPMPTPSEGPTFVLAGGPFLGATGTDLGQALAMSESIVVAGDTTGSGSIVTFRRNIDTWEQLGVVSGFEAGSLFGFSVDLTSTNASVVVGAPGTVKNGTSTAVGSSFVYRLDGSSNVWLPIGSPIRGEEDVFAANEGFGSSVAISETGQVVVAGAPFSSKLNIVRGGRLYAFEFSPGLGNWIPRQAAFLTGDQAESNLGSSVDLSSDGSILVAGGPGRNAGTGYVVVYAWDGFRYSITSTLEGETSGEKFGSSVRILTLDGNYIAAGAPTYNAGQGVIRVFQRQLNGTYSLLGPPIIGYAGDSLGASDSITSGGIDSEMSGLVVLASTASGMLRRYVFDTQTVSWNDATSLSTGFTSSPVIASSQTGRSMVVGGNNAVVVYNLV